MIITEDSVDIDTPTGVMRTHVFKPIAPCRYPGIVLYSEIYQMTSPIARTAQRIASEGYLVAVPEVYHEFEAPGVALAYDKTGTDKGNRYKIEKEIAAFDSDAVALLTYLKSRTDCNGKLGVMGICLGGHLSFRAAMNPQVSASACLYPTDIHQHSLGKGQQDNTFDRIGELQAEMLMIWGRQDPHIPQIGRSKIYQALIHHHVLFSWHEFNAQHAFIRDEGHRYDGALAQICLALTVELFNRRLQIGEPPGLTENPGPNTKQC